MKKMTLASFNAGPSNYEFGLDYYHGKDVVHRGILLKLDPAYSWDKISSKMRNRIRVAQKVGAEIKRVPGNPANISLFRTISFDFDDPSLPPSLAEDEIMYLAYLDGELVAGAILTPSSSNTLYLHNLGSSTVGKQKNLPALVVWHAVEDLAASQYDFLDVGVSFRQNLYNFFRQWRTDSYPIIFEPPFIAPDVRLSPFQAHDILRYDGSSPAIRPELESFFGHQFTILPRGILAIRAVLLYLKVKPSQNVAIYKTRDNDFISRCVTAPIESVCQVSRKIDKNTAAVLVIHEFGHPYTKLKKLSSECKTKGIPLIEDCAWAYGSRIDDTTIGQVGDFAIYSLPKILPLPYGAVLTGVTISDEELWEKYRMLDHYKRATILAKLPELLPTLSASNERRRANWHAFEQMFVQSGYQPLIPLEEGVYPSAFLVGLPDYQDHFERYLRFGVETGRYYHESALILPVHQNLGEAELDYIYGIFRGQMNLCLDFHREE